ncbi:MAG: ATP-dependent DNA helicase [Candidatus Paceibacterota bacterium]|jgi:DNA helicase-2/ATP-dependent DNA helicase PcrA
MKDSSMSRFDRAYAGLNAEQKRAVDAIEGPVMVIAGPGTGKTTMLTLRIANILRVTDTPPDAILALTFTESGVRSMRRKLAEIVGPAAYRVRIHTFHGFANDVIKTYPDRFPRIIGSEHLEDMDALRLGEEIIEGGGFELIRPKNDPTYYVEKALGAVQELKRDAVTSAAFETFLKKREKEISSADDLYHQKGQYAGKMKGAYKDELEKVARARELARFYGEYEARLEESRLYDYEDMIMEVVRALEDDEAFSLRIQEAFIYILADEHQDANKSQNRLLEALSAFHENPNLFIVGDEKQAIFRFQGASLENFLYFKEKFPKATSVTLSDNYRSSQPILDAAHSLISWNPVPDESLRKELRAARDPKGSKISVVSAEDPIAECAYAAGEIASLIGGGVPASEIAVLVRDNKRADGVKRALGARGIAVAESTKGDIFMHPYVEAFVAFLTLLSRPSDKELLGRALVAAFLGIDAIDASKALELSAKERIPLIDALDRFPELKEWKGRLSRWARRAGGDPLVSALESIAHESGFVPFILRHPHAHELIRYYDALLDTAVRFAERNRAATLSTFTSELAHAREYGRTILAPRLPPDGVNLMTAHGSKGLEFDHVFIMHGNDGVWGGRKARSSFLLPTGAERGETEDERRLFYVALTRARRGVVITYAERGMDGKDLSPAQFIYEIREDAREEKKAPRTDAISSRAIAPREPVSLFKDKAYIRKLFIERGFPVTHLNNFIECPWKYFFLDLLRLPRTQESHQLYGSAIHQALNDYFSAYAREEDITIKKAVELFEDYLTRTHMSERDLKAFLAEGREELSGYLSHWEFPRSIWSEYAITGIPFPVGDAEILLNGKLDRVEMISDSTVNVVDVKTGKVKSRNDILGKTKNADGNIKRQITFYKLLLDSWKGGAWKMETGTIDFVKPKESGQYSREVFEVTDTEVEELKALIRDVAAKILDFSFDMPGCGEPDCEWCRQRDAML